MAVSFNTIPQDVRVPLFYAEMDNSQANSFTQSQRTLLIGQMLTTGQATAGELTLVTRTDEAKQLFATGSMLARMYEAARKNDPIGEIWCIPLADDGAASVATGKITITGTATESGTLSVYIAGQLVKGVVVSGDDQATIAASLITAINANANLPVTAAVNGSNDNEVDLTSKWKGETANDIKLMLNYYRAVGGESTPAGLTVGLTAMSGGATNPSLAAAITVMGDEEYDFIIQPYTDSANLNLLRDEMNDLTGRWSYSRQIYGHVYTAMRNTVSGLVTFGDTRNDQHATIAGFESDSPTPVWEYAAEYGARNAVYIKADPARPTQTGELVGAMPAAEGSRFILSERETLLKNGIATSYTQGGVVRVERAITTYQENAFGEPDTSYLDSETMHTSSTILRRLRTAITSKYPRHKLRNDGEKFGAGQAIITPSIARGALIAEYAKMERQGLVENADLFEKYLIVERDADDANRLNILFPADYVNQLRVFALLNQFRLQFSQTA